VGKGNTRPAGTEKAGWRRNPAPKERRRRNHSPWGLTNFLGMSSQRHLPHPAIFIDILPHQALNSPYTD